MLIFELAHSHMSFHKCWNLAQALLTYNDILVYGQHIEITSWKARAYGIFTRVGEVSEIERVNAANE